MISTSLNHSDIGPDGEDEIKEKDDSGENRQKALLSPTRDSAECNTTCKHCCFNLCVLFRLNIVSVDNFH